MSQFSVYDNYVFARKYFSKAWVFYVFVLRLIRLNNPIKEVLGLYNTRGVKRYIYSSEVCNYPRYTKFMIFVFLSLHCWLIYKLSSSCGIRVYQYSNNSKLNPFHIQVNNLWTNRYSILSKNMTRWKKIYLFCKLKIYSYQTKFITT